MELSKIQGVKESKDRSHGGSELAKKAPRRRPGSSLGLPYQWSDRPVYTLRDWWVRDLQNDPFMPPECKHKIICGKVFDKPGFEDGSVICTSTIENAKGQICINLIW